MVTDVPKNTDTNSSNGEGGGIDWDAINAERDARQDKIIELLETQNESISITGFPVGYMDLGIQERKDFEEVYNELDPKHIEKLTKGSFVEDRYNGQARKTMPMLCSPSKPAKAFCLAVDFPAYPIDYGEAIGTQPYRMYMGGSFWAVNPDSDEGKKMKIIQNPMYMQENKMNPHDEWAMGQTAGITKMCLAAGLGDAKGLVKKEKIVEILGKPLQFDVRVWNKPNAKDATKAYYTENIKYTGKVPKGMPLPEFNADSIWGVNMTEKNDPEMVKLIPVIAKNVMKLATNWEGSVLQGELEALKATRKEEWAANNSDSNATEKPVKTSSPVKGGNTPQPKQQAAQGQQETLEDDEWDSDIPF